MSVQAVNAISPVDEYEQRLLVRQREAGREVAAVAGWFVALQVVAATELAVSHVVLWRWDLDVLVTVGMIWAISVPCAGGVALYTLGYWSMLSRRSRMIGLLPWVVVLGEVTAVGVLVAF